MQPHAEKAGRLGRGGISLLLALGIGLPACGALRQNLKNQFVTYRGTWHCPDQKCRQPAMVRANQGHREGDVMVTHVKLNDRAAVVFYPGTPVDSFSAQISCGGAGVAVPDERVLPPGQHKIPGQAESWVVLVDAADYQFGDCKSYQINTHSTWEGGKRQYDEPAGLKVE